MLLLLVASYQSNLQFVYKTKEVNEFSECIVNIYRIITILEHVSSVQSAFIKSGATNDSPTGLDTGMKR